jgi:hypothetical protein
MDTISDEIKNKIYDTLHGDKLYWKSIYSNNVIQEIRMINDALLTSICIHGHGIPSMLFYKKRDIINYYDVDEYFNKDTHIEELAIHYKYNKPPYDLSIW